MYETPVKVSNAYYSPKLSNMQSMKTDLHSSLGFDEYTDEEEHLATSSDHFSSFLEDLCGPFTNEDKTHFSKLPRSSFMANTKAGVYQDRRRTSND